MTPAERTLGERMVELALILPCLVAAPFIQAARMVLKAVQKTWSMAGRLWYGEGS